MSLVQGSKLGVVYVWASLPCADDAVLANYTKRQQNEYKTSSSGLAIAGSYTNKSHKFGGMVARGLWIGKIVNDRPPEMQLLVLHGTAVSYGKIPTAESPQLIPTRMKAKKDGSSVIVKITGEKPGQASVVLAVTISSRNEITVSEQEDTDTVTPQNTLQGTEYAITATLRQIKFSKRGAKNIVQNLPREISSPNRVLCANVLGTAAVVVDDAANACLVSTDGTKLLPKHVDDGSFAQPMCSTTSSAGAHYVCLGRREGIKRHLMIYKAELDDKGKFEEGVRTYLFAENRGTLSRSVDAAQLVSVPYGAVPRLVIKQDTLPQLKTNTRLDRVSKVNVCVLQPFSEYAQMKRELIVRSARQPSALTSMARRINRFVFNFDDFKISAANMDVQAITPAQRFDVNPFRNKISFAEAIAWAMHMFACSQADALESTFDESWKFLNAYTIAAPASWARTSCPDILSTSKVSASLQENENRAYAESRNLLLLAQSYNQSDFEATLDMDLCSEMLPPGKKRDMFVKVWLKNKYNGHTNVRQLTRRYLTDSLTHTLDGISMFRDYVNNNTTKSGHFFDHVCGTDKRSLNKRKVQFDASSLDGMAAVVDVKVVIGNSMNKSVYSCKHSEQSITNKTDKYLDVRNAFVTEKFDGVRARWVPGSSVNEGHFLIGKQKPFTVRTPPKSWSAQCSKLTLLLDGELFCGRGQFYTHKSAINAIDWSDIVYVAFDTHDPRYATLSYDLRHAHVCKAATAAAARSNKQESKILVPPYHRLHGDISTAVDEVLRLARRVAAINGEGLVIKPPNVGYYDSPIIKVKPQHEVTATIIEVVRDYMTTTTSKVRARTNKAPKLEVSVMGVPTEFAKPKQAIVIAFAGYGSKGGLLHARYERQAAA